MRIRLVGLVVAALAVLAQPAFVAAQGVHPVEGMKFHLVFRNVVTREDLMENLKELPGADFVHCDFTKVERIDFYMVGADLERANLSGCDLSGADLRNVNLAGANLQGAWIRFAHLTGANLEGADLRGAHISRDELSEKQLRSAIVDETTQFFGPKPNIRRFLHRNR